MSKQIYSWKRFWCPQSGTINNPADDGYLYDPDAERGKVDNPNLVTLEAIANVPCLVLLGEPGIGKSQELKKLRSYRQGLIDEDDQILLLDLEDYNEEKLYTNLFKSKTFTDWINGTHRLYLFLDSLDQGWLTIKKLPTLLVDEFRKLDEIPKKKDIKPSLLYLLVALQTGFLQKVPKIKDRPNLSRLYLRIACRAAVFSQAENSFNALWGNNLGSYNLTPLRLSDIEIALNAHNLNADACLKEIEHKGLISLAIKPIPLQFLIKKLQRSNGQLSSNQKLIDIYLDGCKELCREPKDEARHPLQPVSNLEVHQRLMIATRIAAITTFCVRSSIWIGQSLGDYELNKDVLISELCGQSEDTNKERGLPITSSVIQELLDTGLFSSRGLHRMGWAHQTYAEFLAAWYLVQHEIPLAQITGLIFSSEAPDHKLIPQLHETAAWLASIRTDVLQEIIRTDPDVLLRSDVPTDANVRSSIVDNLLTQYEEEKLFDWDRNNYRNYAKLKHSGLADQLRPYVCDSSKQIDARDLAIDIAEVCEVCDLQAELVNLALDSSQSVYLRVGAAKALCSIGDTVTRLKLKPLGTEQLPEDEDDRLKGYALQALWSDHLTAEELFQALTVPKKRNFFGGYQMFLNYKIVPQLQPHDLVIALNWLEKQGVRGFGHPFKELGDAILVKAWESFDLPRVAESFTKVALVQWREDQTIITDDNKLQEQFALSLLNNSKRRHTLIEQAVLIILETEEAPDLLLSENVLVLEDIFSMLERLQSFNCEKTQKIWAQLIQLSFNLQDTKHIDAILIATQSNKILQEVFAAYFAPIELNSTQAVNLRADYLRRQEIQERRQNPPLLDPPPKERVLQLLEKLEAGDLSAWWQLNMKMTLKPESKYYDNEFELDLTKLPGWQEAEEPTRRRIIEGAKQYVQHQDDINYDWIGTNTFNRPALAGCRAFQLLLKQNSDFLEHLSPEIWKKWVPIIIAAPSSNQHEDSYLELVKCAYINAPEESIKTLITLINQQNQERDYLSVIDRFDKCWDKRLKLALLEKAKDPKLKPKCLGEILEKLLKQGFTEARNFAKSLISFALPSDENEREKVLIAARVLVENSDPCSWSFIWSLIQQDSSFGREVLELAACHHLHEIQLNLTETQLADLYVWLVRQYPHNEDPDHSNEVLAHWATARDDMARLRDNVLTQLKERGTLQACAEIQRLIQELPNIAWLRKTLINAQINMRRKTWQPPKPEEVLQLVVSPEPSNLELYNQLGKIDRRTQEMAEEPKLDQSIHIAGSEISGVVSTGSGKIENKIDPTSAAQGFDWKFWLSIAVTVTVAIISVTASGVFNDEIKKFLFNRNTPPQVEQKLEK
ncbi:hypothetical protein CSQ79_19415 [Gloeocapsopsis sp. IPPAS B-1203]|nr:hypothetical protein [Gloeocapsopsis sp. IPPAS B-1203]PIG91713.1 hypothetical protein CSQ79_19415 [Gloeocapsopsis sp. IPPAS B-1203]